MSESNNQVKRGFTLHSLLLSPLLIFFVLLSSSFFHPKNGGGLRRGIHGSWEDRGGFIPLAPHIDSPCL